ncbi:porin [Alteromonas pelagimontana]|uniref:Porin n=2 Tax=Alteromonas pelagimontana TaxID=1858656 RepID=A0A6M4MIJ8_9ALTE|nr:porin [Alteromonas pelagimontana]
MSTAALVNAQDSIPVTSSYGDKGFEFRTTDNRFLLQIQSRFQFRYATPSDEAPTALEDYYTEDADTLNINRARLKVGGHAYQPWLKYFWEYDLRRGYLLDYRIMIEKYDWLKFKAGQWKLEYSRERSISSGGQQMLDRSILNRVFTLDRQQGGAVYGHLGGDGLLDFNYWTGITTGTGRGASSNDDDKFLYYGRFQWNVLGGGLEFDASDIKRHDVPAAIIAVAGSTNRSRYTRFSSSGGGALEGFEVGEDGRFKIKQYVIETALMYKGLSWQSEYHRKTVTDTLNSNLETTMSGYYVQAGYFLHESFNWWPKPLEAAFRYASFDPNIDNGDEKHLEKSIAFNWFFDGHSNKLTADITRFDIEQLASYVEDQWRYRLQWDVSF